MDAWKGQPQRIVHPTFIAALGRDREEHGVALCCVSDGLRLDELRYEEGAFWRCVSGDAVFCEMSEPNRKREYRIEMD
jgi:hypothetical protein